MFERIANAIYGMRAAALRKLTGQTRDIDLECGYPTTITAQEYMEMYRRFGVARRAVHIWPEESWQRKPEINDTADTDESDFEKAVKELNKKRALFHYLVRTDVMSGIGRFGLLFFGFGDGKDTTQPVVAKDGLELLFLRVFDETKVEIASWESDTKNERYGKPTTYNVTMQSSSGQHDETLKIHWTRVLHVADNRGCDEVYGKPRLEDAYNHLLDIKKLAGGSSEMFWRGGFPGYAFTLDPTLVQAGMPITIDKEEMKEEIRQYSEGLKRYLNLTGVNPQSLAVQVADPTGHFKMLVQLVALSVNAPYRKFVGAEEAKVAAITDDRTWNDRLRFRQTNYLDPMLVRPAFDTLIKYGVLPAPQDDTYEVDWPDLDELGEKEKAENAKTKTEALAAYARGSVDEYVPPRAYYQHVLGFDEDTIDAIEKELEDYQDELNKERETEAAAREAALAAQGPAVRPVPDDGTPQGVGTQPAPTSQRA